MFYAGCGSLVKIPDTQLSVGALCPIDERTTNSGGGDISIERHKYCGSPVVNLFLVITILQTVILDTCHAGGMGRDFGKGRAAHTPSVFVPPELDTLLWKSNNEVEHSHSMWSPNAESHVLLAACHQDETAREISFTDSTFHGRFTESLVTWLRRVSLETTTYSELLNRLPIWSGQTPYCGGRNLDKLVFNGNYSATGRRMFPLKLQTSPDPERGILQSFLVDIGAVEGVVPGTEFSVHVEDNSILCTLTTHSVMVHETILVSKSTKPVDIPAMSRVVVSDWKEDPMVLQVYTYPGFPYASDLFPKTKIIRQSKGRKFLQAQSPETADIVMRSVGDAIFIERLTSTIIECGRETRLTLKGKNAHLPAVVDGIAHFNYFLERHHGSAPLVGVGLEMHRLLGEHPRRTQDLSVGDNGNMIVQHQARFSFDAEAKYGFTIRNTSEEDLFPYLFYFDPVNYTIDCWYSPDRRHEPPLYRRSGTVTIGMGNERAFEFALPSHSEQSSGFLKMFVSTQHLDLEWIQQRISPFDPTFEGTGRLEPIIFFRTPLVLASLKKPHSQNATVVRRLIRGLPSPPLFTTLRSACFRHLPPLLPPTHPTPSATCSRRNHHATTETLPYTRSAQPRDGHSASEFWGARTTTPRGLAVAPKSYTMSGATNGSSLPIPTPALDPLSTY
ncbi:hypothetical protein DFH09DRAFT_1113008 [Mycena vulgaris]|nr:hypothetical protein DFH09DRAFT_1113008 [Mycena vulgaris]